MDNQKAIIFNIQKFSIHDGPGIRTVVFFKGCPLRCKWCSNPESQSSQIEITWDATKSINCNKCMNICPEGAIVEENGVKKINKDKCILCEKCVEECPTGAFAIEGEYKTINEIMSEILKDIDFYKESGGGVTLSGGEVLKQAGFAIQLSKELKKHDIHIAAETTGYTSPEIFEEFIEHIDLLLFDVKHYNSQKHKEGTGVENTLILKNLQKAVEKDKNIIARIPVIPNFSDSIEDSQQFSELLNKIGIKQVNLLPFHQFGEKKYELLGREYQMKDVTQLHLEDLMEYKEVFLQNNLDCKF